VLSIRQAPFRARPAEKLPAFRFSLGASNPAHLTQVGAVVVGFDRRINYHKIQTATLCIRENPGCHFIATNLDAVTHLTDAQEWAGNGAMVGAIKGKRETHHESTLLPWTRRADGVADRVLLVPTVLDCDLATSRLGRLQG